MSYVPKPKAPTRQEGVRGGEEYIRVNHKNLLEDWKNRLSGRAARIYLASNKKTYTMSLNLTCMNCHGIRRSSVINATIIWASPINVGIAIYIQKNCKRDKGRWNLLEETF